MQLNITDKVLDNLGFSEYWDENGDWGGRTLTFSNGTHLRIMDIDEKDDDSDGYSIDGVYIAHHFVFAPWFAIPKIEGPEINLFFLQDLYLTIERYYPNCTQEFIDKCTFLKMNRYIIAKID